jgi:hypothetical protein
MLRKTPVTVAASMPGAAVKSPACTVAVRPGSVTVSTSVQCVPSAESYPVPGGELAELTGHSCGQAVWPESPPSSAG